MTSKFETMNRQELKNYVLTHRDDQEALNWLIQRRSSDAEAVWYDGEPSPAQTQEALRQKIDQPVMSE